MNVAFPVLLIILFFLPGLFFTLAFYNTEDNPLTYKAAVSFLVTFILHLFFITLLLQTSSYQPNLIKLLILVSGTQDHLYAETIKSISQTDLLIITLYLILIYIVAFLIGKLLRYTITKLKLDKRFEIFRLDSPWYYLLKGYDCKDGEPDGVIISACIELAGRGYLYQGYLEDFFLDKEGNITQ